MLLLTVGRVDNRGVWAGHICDAHPPHSSCAETGGALLQTGPGHGGEDKNCALLFAPVEEATLYHPGDPRVQTASDLVQEIIRICTNYDHLPFSVSQGATCIQRAGERGGYDYRGVIVGPQDGHGAAQAGLVYYRSALHTVQLEGESMVDGPTLFVAVLGPRVLPDP